jgi:CheY-like chemotaxis protein
MRETATSVSTPQAVHTPTVYFIDDSATMREVIKIAFRKENINVVACHDAASAIAQMDETRPDVVISDVIMPDKDGYEVCQHIKQHSQFGRTPVILMSGVVNRTVADKALAVKADELIRKPFLPQELIARVKNLLKPPAAAPATPQAASGTASAWNNVFAPNAAPVGAPWVAPAAKPLLPVVPRPAPAPAAPAVAAPPVLPGADTASSAAIQKLRVEVQRLDQLVKKLRTELDAERQYSRSLEENIKALQETNS